MRISFNQRYNINYSFSGNNIAGQKINFTSRPDTFEKSETANVSAKKATVFKYEDFEDRASKFGIQDYLSLDDIAKDEIKMKIPNFLMEAVDDNVREAINYKEFLDKEYGEGAYTLVSIGVSPSLIAKVFECIGVNTRYAPISQLSRNYAQLADYDFTNYFKFLKTQEISPEDVEKSDKKMVFVDYTGSGFSLDNFEKIMIEKLGLPPEKCDFRSINKDMRQASSDIKKTNQYIDKYFKYCDSDFFTSIAHLSVLTIDDAPMARKRLTLHERPCAKMFNFAVMDELNKRGLLKENPENDCAL